MDPSLEDLINFTGTPREFFSDTSLPSARVISELEQLVEWRGKPDKIRVDNGPEFIAEKLKIWCRTKQIEFFYTAWKANPKFFSGAF